MIERTAMITPEPGLALAALLDVPAPAADEGLPLTWHWLHLLERTPQADLGPDGHAVRGGIPDPPGPRRRRMWAGGSIRTLGPLLVGREAIRRSEVLSTTDKDGRSGRLTFVTVGHTISQAGDVVVEERQDLVYRDRTTVTPPDVEPVAPAIGVAPDEWSVPVTPTLLFRFSALTYNAHRIHYDRGYARDEEGYPGLVVHGPLQALAMAEVARARFGPARPGSVFDYRLVAPLLDHQGLVAGLSGTAREPRTSVRDASGRRTAEGVLRRGHDLS